MALNCRNKEKDMKIDLNVLWKTPNAAPLYQQLKELVKGAIIAGTYQVGEKLENEREFIEVGHLSYPTVSRALRELAAEGYLYRKVGQGTTICTPPPASGIRRLAVVYYNLETPYFHRLRTGLEAECSRHHIDLCCLATGTTFSEEEQVIDKELLHGGFDAVLGYPFGSMELNVRLSRMIDEGLSVVMMGTFYSQFNCDSVAFDHENGGEAAGRFLISHGYKRILQTGPSPKFPFNMLSVATEKGIRQAIAEAGKPVQYSRLVYSVQKDGNYSEDYGEKLRRLFSGTDEPLGIICDSDGHARNVVRHLLELGVKIPEQAAVIGAGDLPEYTLKESPSISTVAWPLERMGREAVRRAIAQRNSSRSTPVNIILDTTLVCRDTTPGD